MAEKAARGIDISRASASMRKEKERRRNALRNILGPDFDSREDDSSLIRDVNLAYVIITKNTHHVFNDSPPLMIKNVVVETKQGYKSEPREKLKAENALFYISYEYNGVSPWGWARDLRAIIRKTIDGKPGHMCLDVVDRTEEEAEQTETYGSALL